ncbi:MAG TPA: acetylornithine deacetylase, partial [Planctomycetaceae bacterium]|nr:acetylornithine deacetylase [Planctomycetaceae bacterium]
EQTVPLYFFVTGDEESGMLGADHLSANSSAFGELVDAGGLGIVGEPTSLEVVTAHKGAVHIEVTSHGVAAHSSTRDGHNANWQLIPFLSYLREVNERCESDARLKNGDFDPPTLSMNVVLENEPSMANITVGKARLQIFMRPMPNTLWEQLLAEIIQTAKDQQLQVKTLRPMRPLVSNPGSSNLQWFMKTVGSTSGKSVCYATDGCCLGSLSDMVVYGPGSIEQAHRNDEWISIDQLHQGTKMFERVFRSAERL